MDIGLQELTAEREAEGYCEDDVMSDGKPCIIFWP